ncbi:MAG: deoxyguanosinetriphosphate triphosphohydrolase [Flavobacteriales bacterium]
MNWENLLSLRRDGDITKRLRKEENPIRSGFEVDFDRIIFSSAFRCLQDKTQVIPLPKSGFVHNRLTHSLETSSVGRSLGRIVGKMILDKHPHLKQTLGYQIDDFGAIVAAACLAHDIGNPPFGHFGEKAIGNYFSNGKGLHYKEYLTTKQWHDLTRFEGNANGFKILTQHKNGIKGGVRLTYATLGTFTKYPKDAVPIENSLLKSQKKFGFFQSEREQFEAIAQELNLEKIDSQSWMRHPLAYLLEAADDICYSIIDFEDGLNLGWIPEEAALEFMIPIVKDVLITEKYHKMTVPSDRFSYLRALTIGVLVQDLAQVFIKNEEAILCGTFNHALLDKSKYNAQVDDIKRLTIEKVYNHPKVLETEAFGHEIITGILHTFVTAVNLVHEGKASYYNHHILKLLPSEYHSNKNDSLYTRILNITSFVSEMTDKNAISLYKKLKGIELVS